MIGSVIKYFRFSFDYVLYEISYLNLMMLLNTIPVYKKDKTSKGDNESRGVEEVQEVASMADFMKLGIQ